MRIDDVARALGCSVGASAELQPRARNPPEAFARIVRLNAVLAGLDAAERASAVDVALAAGYLDQAHLLRDFRALAGRTPRASRERDGGSPVISRIPSGCGCSSPASRRRSSKSGASA